VEDFCKYPRISDAWKARCPTLPDQCATCRLSLAHYSFCEKDTRTPCDTRLFTISVRLLKADAAYGVLSKVLVPTLIGWLSYILVMCLWSTEPTKRQSQETNQSASGKRLSKMVLRKSRSIASFCNGGARWCQISPSAVQFWTVNSSTAVACPLMLTSVSQAPVAAQNSIQICSGVSLTTVQPARPTRASFVTLPLPTTK
jgi:hypothetical protein